MLFCACSFVPAAQSAPVRACRVMRAISCESQAAGSFHSAPPALLVDLLVPVPHSAERCLRQGCKYPVLGEDTLEICDLLRGADSFDYDRIGIDAHDGKSKRRGGLEHRQLCQTVAGDLEECNGSADTIEGGEAFDPADGFESQQQGAHTAGLF